jgi:hypothetical protein
MGITLISELVGQVYFLFLFFLFFFLGGAPYRALTAKKLKFLPVIKFLVKLVPPITN